MTPRAAALLGFVLGVVYVGALSSCTPPARSEAVEPSTRAVCVLLRAVGMDGRLAEVCATAEELAPLVSELLAARGESPAATPAPLVAFSLPAGPRRVPRRRCASWVPASVNGGSDAGPDGAQ